MDWIEGVFLTCFFGIKIYQSKHNFNSIYAYLKFEKIVFKSNSPVLIFANHLLVEFKYGSNSNTVSRVVSNIITKISAALAKALGAVKL